ncbi:hypothetical protein ACFLS9_01445 [Bacteroidota bacterium]
MKGCRLVKFVVFGIMLFFFVQSTAVAQQFYGAASLGIAGVPMKDQAKEDGLYEEINDDVSVTAFRVLAGVKVLPYAMFEVGYIGFGDVKFDGKWTWEGVQFEDKGTISTSGISASVVGVYSLVERISLLGKLGLFRYSVEENENFDGTDYSNSATGFSPIFGIGVLGKLVDNFGARIEWQHIFKVGEKGETGETEINAFWASIVYYFGI